MKTSVFMAMGKRNRQRAREIWAAAGGVCGICWDPVSKWSISTDHTVPRSKGGSNARANLQPAHRACNNEKGDAVEVTEELLARIAARRGTISKRLAGMRSAGAAISTEDRIALQKRDEQPAASIESERKGIWEASTR